MAKSKNSSVQIKNFVSPKNESKSGEGILASFSLPKGTWLLIGHTRVAGGSAGRRGLELTTGTIASASDSGNNTIYVGTSGNHAINCELLITVSSSTTINLLYFTESNSTTFDYNVNGIKLSD